MYDPSHVPPLSTLLFWLGRRGGGPTAGCWLRPLLEIPQATTAALGQAIVVDSPFVVPGSLGQALPDETKQRHCRDRVSDP